MHVEKGMFQVLVPTMPNSQLGAQAIVDHVIMTELKYVVVNRHEHSVAKRCAEGLHFHNVQLRWNWRYFVFRDHRTRSCACRHARAEPHVPHARADSAKH